MHVFFQHGFIQGVLMMAAFFFGLDQSCFNQDLYVMRNRGLRQVQHLLYLRTLPASPLVGNMMEDLEPV